MLLYRNKNIQYLHHLRKAQHPQYQESLEISERKLEGNGQKPRMMKRLVTENKYM